VAEEQARTQVGDARKGAAVCELIVLISRRERLHPGTCRSLFPTLEFQISGFHTDAERPPVDLEATTPAYAHVEAHLRRLGALGSTHCS
jgi:hypothetical protein